MLPCPPESPLPDLLPALLTRHVPADTVERHWVEELAHLAECRRLLRRVEAVALARAARAGHDAEAAEAARLEIATLARYRARLERGQRLALEHLVALRRTRPRVPCGGGGEASPAQLRYIADLIEQGQESAANTNEPEDRAGATTATLRPAPAAAGTNEPEEGREGAAGRPNRHERRRLAALGRAAAALGRAAAARRTA